MLAINLLIEDKFFIKRSSMEEIRVTSNPLQIRKKLGNFKLRFYSQKET